ncbi:MAG: hypothetical protein ACRCUT_07405, partial [Spirochaetota bacterium]
MKRKFLGSAAAVAVILAILGSIMMINAALAVRKNPQPFSASYAPGAASEAHLSAALKIETVSWQDNAKNEKDFAAFRA